MRIPDEIEDLVLAFMEPDKKKELKWMTREEIDVLIMGEAERLLKLGYAEKSTDASGFPYRVTPRGKEILQVLSPCKRCRR